MPNIIKIKGSVQQLSCLQTDIYLYMNLNERCSWHLEEANKRLSQSWSYAVLSFQVHKEWQIGCLQYFKSIVSTSNTTSNWFVVIQWIYTKMKTYYQQSLPLSLRQEGSCSQWTFPLWQVQEVQESGAQVSPSRYVWPPNWQLPTVGESSNIRSTQRETLLNHKRNIFT